MGDQQSMFPREREELYINEDQELQIRKLHTRMISHLCKHFHPKLETWENLMLLLSAFLEPVDLFATDNTFQRICTKLMANGTIGYGDYDQLYDVIIKIDVTQARIIRRTSHQIRRIQSRGFGHERYQGRDREFDTGGEGPGHERYRRRYREFDTGGEGPGRYFHEVHRYPGGFPF